MAGTLKFICERKKIFFRKKINIRSSQLVIFFLLHRYECRRYGCFNVQCPKQRNDVSDIFTSEDMENISLVSRM